MLFVGDREVDPHRVYRAAFITEQGVPARFGHGRRDHPETAIDALKTYLKKRSPVSAELKGAFRVV